MGLWGYVLRPVRILGLYLLLFFMARAVLVLVYPLDFAALDRISVLRAFCAGSLYDLSIISMVAGLPLFMLALPFPFADRRRWQSVWGWIAFAVFGLFAFLLAGDLVYFDFIHTSCTHEPLKWPRPEFDRFPDDTRENRYRNALAYADHALGEFFDRARREPWFDRTILILSSDHVQRSLGTTNDPVSLFHIPALILAPGLTPRIDSRVGAQTDLMATITDLAGWSTPHAGIGKSLLDDTGLDERGALCRFSEMVYRIEAKGWVGHSLRKRVQAGRYEEGADLDAIERRLLSTVQTAATLLLKNRLAPK